MALEQMVHRVRCAVIRHGSVSDGQLLDRFIADRDEAAFAALVERHGAMVFGVCRRVVGHVQDAEDAFQATFLVLVRKAPSVMPREAVGNWLHGVAHRTALEAKSRKARRRAREMQVDDMPHPVAPPPSPWRELQPVLDREVSRLPDRYRLPVVLCDLEGRGRQEVSRRLRIPEGTLSSRLARGRKLLAGRLARHGFALSATALAAALAPAAASANVPPMLVGSTVQAATGGSIAAPVAALVEGVLHTMLMSKLKNVALALVLVACIGTGVSVVRREVRAAPAPNAAPVVSRTEAEVVEETTGGREESPRNRPNVVGRITGVAKDGKSITLEVAPAGREAPAKKVDITLTAKTKLLFSGVGVGGAKLTEGYRAHVWTADGARDTAERIYVMGNRGERDPPSISGLVIGLNKDGKTLRIQIARRGRGEGDNNVLVRMPDETHVLYSNVAKGGAQPTEGYRVDVWLKHGSKDVASRLNFTGSAVGNERRIPMANVDYAGRVVGVSQDGTVLTLAPQSRERAQAPAKQEIKLSDKTITAYFQVAANGAKPTDGYIARAWLAEGSKDTAGKIIFQGVQKEPPTLRGKVTAIAKDGTSITLESPARERGTEPARKTVKLTKDTKLTFQNVGLDGALLAEGYIAQVLLEDGSTDTAAHVTLTPASAVGERRPRE